MERRKRITPLQRARQRVVRVGALEMSLAYERKIRTNRTRGIRRALDDLRDRGVPPVLWADEVDYTEPWMTPLLTDLYLTIGHTGAVEAANRLLAKKADVRDVFAQAILDWTSAYLGERIVLMGETISTWLRETLVAIYSGTTTIIVDGVEEEIPNSSLGVEKLTKMLYKETQQRWDDVKKWMCRRIAHTESMNSLNVAAQKAADALGIPYEKTWSISGLNTRPTHEVMDGVTLGQNELFDVGGYPMERPMDERFGAPAGEVINCSCTLIYLPADNNIDEI